MKFLQNPVNLAASVVGFASLAAIALIFVLQSQQSLAFLLAYIGAMLAAIFIVTALFGTVIFIQLAHISAQNEVIADDSDSRTDV